MSGTPKTYTIEQIRAAFWDQFHKAGEVWFDYLRDEQESQQATESHWSEFKKSLESNGRLRKT